MNELELMNELKVSIPVPHLMEMLDVLNYYARGDYDGGKRANEFMNQEPPEEVASQLLKITETLMESFKNN